MQSDIEMRLRLFTSKTISLKQFKCKKKAIKIRESLQSINSKRLSQNQYQNINLPENEELSPYGFFIW